MSYSVKVSEDFLSDVLDVTSYISIILFNPDAAEQLRENINLTIENIAKNPKIYSILRTEQETIYEYRRAKVGNYYIIYHFDDENVYISRLIFGRRNFNSIRIW